MSRRINIVLPETTVRAIDRLAKPGQRSRFINDAVQHFVTHCSAEAVRAQLERTAVRDQDLDREITREWLAVDQESWQRLDREERPAKKLTPGTGKSTSPRSIRR